MIVFVVLLVLGGFVVFIKTQKSIKPQTSLSSGQQMKTFKSSSVMDFTIEVPSEFEVKEQFGLVIISTPDGEINISKNGTNFDNLTDHIEELEKLNRFSFQKLDDLIVNNLPAQKGNLNGEKVYFFYSNAHNVYSISTSSESLYNDLDRIAQTFRYTP